MHVPKGAPLDEYEITYTLQNKTTKETKSVTDKVYLQQELWKDENWEVIGDPTSRLVKEGYQAPIKDLSITDAQGVDYTKEIIENPYYNLLFVSYNLDKANLKALNKVNELAKRASEEYNIRTVLLTASTAQQVSELDSQTKLYAETFFADAIPLKSMVRANPGIMLLKNGIVVKKWHYRTLPSFETLAKRYFEHLD
ncbi:hypothetical protein RYH73_10810 [Olivibacter sp. CPCC 100613]|uniref:hypothetical protein n=1 Tax=Olivibacter sp. CPCC 100613 TaxID=3079931 RepID=UPI002FF5802F